MASTILHQYLIWIVANSFGNLQKIWLARNQTSVLPVHCCKPSCKIFYTAMGHKKSWSCFRLQWTPILIILIVFFSFQAQSHLAHKPRSLLGGPCTDGLVFCNVWIKGFLLHEALSFKGPRVCLYGTRDDLYKQNFNRCCNNMLFGIWHWSIR